MGADSGQKSEIVFSMERKNNEEASLLLYKKGSKEVIQEIPFPATNTIGDIVCVKAGKNSICTI